MKKQNRKPAALSAEEVRTQVKLRKGTSEARGPYGLSVKPHFKLVFSTGVALSQGLLNTREASVTIW